MPNTSTNTAVRTTETVKITGRIKYQSKGAVLFQIFDEDTDDYGDPMWFPLSQIRKITEGSKVFETKAELVITAWIAKQKGVI